MDKHSFVVFWFVYSEQDADTYLSKTETIRMRLLEMIKSYGNIKIIDNIKSDNIILLETDHIITEESLSNICKKIFLFEKSMLGYVEIYVKQINSTYPIFPLCDEIDKNYEVDN